MELFPASMMSRSFNKKHISISIMSSTFDSSFTSDILIRHLYAHWTSRHYHFCWSQSTFEDMRFAIYLVISMCVRHSGVSLRVIMPCGQSWPTEALALYVSRSRFAFRSANKSTSLTRHGWVNQYSDSCQFTRKIKILQISRYIACRRLRSVVDSDVTPSSMNLMNVRPTAWIRVRHEWDL